MEPWSEVFVIYGNQVESMVPAALGKNGRHGSAASGRQGHDKTKSLGIPSEVGRGQYGSPSGGSPCEDSKRERYSPHYRRGWQRNGYSATKAFEYCGYRDMASRYGLNLVDLERDEFIEKPVHMEGLLKAWRLLEPLLNATISSMCRS